MKRKLTPFIILALYTMIYGIYVLITGIEWDIFIAIFLIISSPILFFIDLGLKKVFKKVWKLIVFQLLVILAVVSIYNYQNNRTKTLELPDGFNNDYVTIIYGIKGEKDLSISTLTFWKTLKIPESGILLTSSKFHEDLPQTKIRFRNGVYLNSEQTKKEFVEMLENDFENAEKYYRFRSWKIQDENCCSFTKTEVQKHKIELKKIVKKNKASS